MAISTRHVNMVKGYMSLVILVLIVVFLFTMTKQSVSKLRNEDETSFVDTLDDNVLHQLSKTHQNSVIRWALSSLTNTSEDLNKDIKEQVNTLFKKLDPTNGGLELSSHDDKPITSKPIESSKYMLADLPQSFFKKGANGEKPVIPKIIHQTWDTYMVPKSFAPWIKSIVDNNPDWEYWFWTPDDVRCLLKKYYREYANLYESYWAMIFKSDVMRYFVLYHFGGFYIDLDVDCFKSLDPWVYEQAVFLHETYEHPYLVHSRDRPNVMTTIMATREHHPVMRMLFESLPDYHKKFPNDVLKSTGPFFLDSVYNKYIETETSKHLNNSVTVVHPKYFLPTFDYPFKSGFKKTCRDGKNKKGEPLSEGAVEVCKLLEARNYNNTALPESFTEHHWVHVNLQPQNFKKTNLVSLFDFAPNAKKVSSFLSCS